MNGSNKENNHVRPNESLTWPLKEGHYVSPGKEKNTHADESFILVERSNCLNWWPWQP